MKISRLSAVPFALVAALAVSTSGTATAAPSTPSAAPAAVAAPSTAAADAQRVQDLLAQLPDWKQRRDAARERFNIGHSSAQEMVSGKLDKAIAAFQADPDAAIDPTDYECAATDLDAYVDGILAPVDPFSLFVLQILGALDVPTYDALLFGTKTPEYAVARSHADRLNTAFGTATRFWDVQLTDIQFLGMHGEVLTDVAKVARTFEFLYGDTPEQALAYAEIVREVVLEDPALQGGAHPIFTLNAFAFSGKGDPDPFIAKLRDKMVYGDGLLDALKTIGLNKIGPEAVLQHEVAHHVQYEDNLFESSLSGPEATRRTELMADAFGTYILVHKLGANIKAAQVTQVGDAFYVVGDCSFSSDGHHGTPNQRRAASTWGANEAGVTPNKIRPSLKLAQQFDAILPTLVAPDAPRTVRGWQKRAAA